METTKLCDDPDYIYILAERLGMACGPLQSTAEQLDCARQEAREYVQRRDRPDEEELELKLT